MKARLARIAGLVLAGTLVVSTAAIDQKSKNTDADISATVASGVTSALSGSLSDATMGVAGVSGMDVARTAQGQEAVEEGTESAEAGVDASTSSAAAGVSAELADAATVASQAQDELTETESTEERRALTDIPISVWRMLRAISTSVQRQALMQMSWARCRTTQDVRFSAWKANGHRLSPVPWKVM